MTNYCSHPTCYESSDNTTLYKEPTPHNDKGWMAVCGEHLDREKVESDDHKVTVIKTGERAAEAANAEILAGLQK